MLLNVETTLNAAADPVWQAIKNPATLVEVTAGLMVMPGLESLPDEWFVGQSHTARLTVVHIPLWMHHLKIIQVDETRREVITEEHGGWLRAWNHRLKVMPLDEQRCRYSDRVDVRAGILTPVAWILGHLFYRYRQRRLRRLVQRMAAAVASPTSC